MKILRFARLWCVLAVGLAVLAVAGPSAGGRLAPSTNHDWSIPSTPNPGVYGNIIWGMSARTANDVWAVGVQETQTSNDTLAIHWNGAGWTAVPTPNPMPDCQDGNIQWGGQSLNSVAAISAKDVWAVGSSCYSFDAIIEHWNGTAWSMVAGASPTKDGGGATASLYGVAAISPSNVWAVGYSGAGGFETMIEHWNGSSWQVSSGGGVMQGYLSSVSATGPNDVWAAGATNNANLIEHWNGASWAVVQTPQPAGSAIDSITALSPSDAWAVGSKRGSSGGDVTFTLHWDGTSWNEVASPNVSTAGNATNQLRSVAVISKNDIWALGMYRNEQTLFQHRTLALHWDGSSWSLVDSPTPGRTGELTSSAAVPSGVTPGQLFAGGYFSYYDRNIYDGHYTDPRTLVLRG